MNGCIARRQVKAMMAMKAKQEEGAAVTIQSVYRGRGHHRDLIWSRTAAIRIQATWRAYQIRESVFLFSGVERAVAETMKKAGAAQRIQGCLQGCLVRRNLKRNDTTSGLDRLAALDVLQALYSGWSVREVTRPVLKEIELEDEEEKQETQRRDTRKRVKLLIQEVSSFGLAAITIQSLWRGMRARAAASASKHEQVWDSFQRNMEAAVRIQRWYRNERNIKKGWMTPLRPETSTVDGGLTVAECIKFKTGSEPSTPGDVMDEYELLVRFLRAVGLEDLIERFREEGISFSDLRLITLDELEEIGFPILRQKLTTSLRMAARVVV